MFDNIISLGFFCGVAQETERLGLRSKSMPFDWVISTNFQMVLELIENNFQGFVGVPHYYDDYSNRADNEEYDIQFFHDFKRCISIEQQLSEIQNKYRRRALYFSDAVLLPTLFIRYIYSVDEFEWIKTHHERIEKVIKKDNKQNDIIFIGHQDADDNFGYRYFKVNPDEGDVVARKFTQSNRELLSFLTDSLLFNPMTRKKNRLFYKYKKFKELIKKFTDKGKTLVFAKKHLG